MMTLDLGLIIQCRHAARGSYYILLIYLLYISSIYTIYYYILIYIYIYIYIYIFDQTTYCQLDVMQVFLFLWNIKTCILVDDFVYLCMQLSVCLFCKFVFLFVCFCLFLLKNLSVEEV